MLPAHNGSLSTLLIVPLKENSDKPLPKKSCGRVLTSKENIKAMEEKEQAKQQKLKQKEERKQQLEKRRQEKAKLAAEKKCQKESKRVQKTKVKKPQLGPEERIDHEKEKTADGGEGSFTEEEIKLFETRLENGYDLTIDDRYNAWLETKCPRAGDGLQEPSRESRKASCGSSG